MEDFNSEISGSSCSIPSEPPDIRNWFSSYKYESFVLDTCENFGGIFSEERESHQDEVLVDEIDREKDDNVDRSEEIRKLDEHGGSYSREVEASLHSPSIISEPPDIRNWFSSYVYESPSYVTRESEWEKDDIACGEGIKFKDETAHYGQFQDSSCKQISSEKTCSKKLVKCSTFLVDRKNESNSPFSEPPDIRNLFSDYVYESPVLDSSEEFRIDLSKDREANVDKFAVKYSNKEKKQDNLKTITKTRCIDEVAVGKMMLSAHLGKSTNSQQNDEQENKSMSKDIHRCEAMGNLSWHGDLSIEKIMNLSSEYKQVEVSCIKSEEGVENSGSNGGESVSKVEMIFSGTADSQLNPGKNEKKSSKRFIDRRDSTEKSSETKVQTDNVDLPSHDHSKYIDQIDGFSSRKSTHGYNDKENEGQEIAADGFITTKKNTRTNYENSPRLRGQQGILLQCSTNKGSNIMRDDETQTENENEKLVTVNRKGQVLAEITNVNVQQSEAMGITGKWRCPQKSKPLRGPPLKQLRLEQWIRRA